MSSEPAGEDASRVADEIRVQGLLRLAPDTVYEGDLHAPEGLVVPEGTVVEGDVYTDGHLELAEASRICGQVHSCTAPGSHGSGEDAPSADAADAHAGLLDPIPQPARSAAGSDDELLERLERFAEATLGHVPPRPWPTSLVRELLFADGVGSLAPVTVGEEDADGFVLRVHRQETGSLPPDRDDDPTRGVTEAVRRLGQAARPSLDVHPLSSPETPGDVVLLVRDKG